MLTIRRSNERGHADHGWLKSMHTFSFANYYDPAHMGFRDLRVINEDRIEGGTGFGTHGHADMEIISYVLDGALEHQDSMGNKTTIRPGEVQRMSAGTGVRHSEYNAIKDRVSHFFQIWILPNRRGLNPGYGQKSFESELQSGRLVLVVSQDGRDGSIPIAQDADLYIARPKKGASLDFKLRGDRYVWIQVVKGDLKVNEAELSTGDAVAISQEKALEILAKTDAEFLLFDLN